MTLMLEVWKRRRRHRGGTKAVYCGWVKVAPNTKGAESSVPVASVWVLEHHHPTMILIWGHVDRSKKNK